MAARPVVIFLRSEGWEARYLAVTTALTAAAMGDEVTVALFFGALRAWVDGRFDEGAPAEAAAARVGPLRATLDEGRRELGLRVVACDTAVRLAGVEPAAARSALDGVVGLPALWRAAQGGQALSF
jgi:peroxiredoxin family protein